MTRSEVVRAAFGRLGLSEGSAGDVVAGWLRFFSERYVFGPRDVMALCRLLRRELGLR